MEKGKNNIGIIICLIVVILGLVGFIVYDKVVLDNDKKVEGKDDNKNNDIEEKENYTVLELSPTNGDAILYKGEVYVNIYDSSVEVEALYGKDSWLTLYDTVKKYSEYDFNGLELKDFEDNNKKWLKLDITNVKGIYNNVQGQAPSFYLSDTYGIILLNEDNTVSFASIKDLIKGEKTPIKLEVTDIKEVIFENNGGYITYLVDNNGNKTDVNNYIENNFNLD